MCYFFLSNQKTAYEMRISDWSSYVCSSDEGSAIKREYLEAIKLIERLHRQFLEVVKTELDRIGVEDINNIQALILFNIGDEELTVGELTNRGYYLGSNVSYNVRDRKSTRLNSSH